VRKKIQIAGILFFLYMIYNGIMRFLIEEIRVNDKSSFLGIEMSQAQKISTLFVVGGITGILWLINRDKKNRVNQEIVQ
jgi:phosphatidylglycerol:prolipoprotein diacylglycerol transferase